MNDEEGFIYKEALDKWGVQSQLQMAIEECAEFIVKAAKLYRNKNNSTPLEVIEEIADVKIMMEQMEIVFGENLVKNAKTRKLERLKKLLIEG